jgi:predicted dehydrogenase
MIAQQIRTVRVLVVAIGGYGFYYLKTLLDQFGPAGAKVAGIVDPEAQRSPAWPAVVQLGVPVYPTIEEFYAAGHEADLAVIASPIHYHVAQSAVALAHGSNVLCDKPLGATIQEADALIAARDRSRRWVMIGYQWSFSAAILALKHDILAGLFGRPQRFSALCCWPRDTAYYGRNTWAGRLREAATGRLVLDGPANNAMAHFLHNLFFVLGRAPHLSACPHEIQAELYRAYSIESYDTAACRTITDEGVETCFYASHATDRAIEPRFRFEFEDAVVTCGEGRPTIVATDFRGHAKDYGAPDDTAQFRKLFAAVEATWHEVPVVCGPEAARSQTLAINGMHESAPEAAGFPSGLVSRGGEPERVAVGGLADMLADCYRRGCLPSEAPVAWAVPGRRVNLAGYRWYPGGAQGGLAAAPASAAGTAQSRNARELTKEC